MTKIKEQAFEILQDIPDDKITHVIEMLKGLRALYGQSEKSTEAQIYGEQLLDTIKRKNIPHKTVEVNAEGHIIVDKDKDPELYDWAVNG